MLHSKCTVQKKKQNPNTLLLRNRVHLNKSIWNILKDTMWCCLIFLIMNLNLFSSGSCSSVKIGLLFFFCCCCSIPITLEINSNFCLVILTSTKSIWSVSAKIGRLSRKQMICMFILHNKKCSIPYSAFNTRVCQLMN